MKFPLKSYFLNPITMAGVIVAVICFGASTVLLILDFGETHTNPYRGVMAFFVFPGLMFAGLAVAVAGALLEVRRRRGLEAGAVIPAFWSRPYMKPGLAAFTAVVLLLSSVGGYRAYEFTDSVQFCGELCHAVMHPEHVAYQNSPHARVKCVECHVGPGAQWYVKAKLSGLYQIYATVADKFPRPIPTPISSLRPAQETCEQCHWPEKFWGAQLTTRIHAGFDFANTRRELVMLVKTGGGGTDHGPSEGIHWHMNIANRVEYIARDEKRLDIPWVRVRHPDGTVVEYTDPARPLTPEEAASLPRRRMDCMDCHNRPTHIYLSPVQAVDRLFALGKLAAAIPFLKQEAVAALARPYASTEAAMGEIGKTLVAGYRQRHPEVLESHAPGLAAAAEALKAIYAQNFFPEMKADWSVYPSHIGHQEFPGCFRCHSGRHRAADGKVLSRDCELCHTFAAHSSDRRSLLQVPSDGAFVHPWRTEHADLDCWDCHTGRSSPYTTCGQCHEREPDAPMPFACTVCHWPLHPAQPAPAPSATHGSSVVQHCGHCHDLEDSDAHRPAGHRNCTACHEPHGWRVPVPAACAACHEKFMKGHNPGESCVECHDFSDVSSTLAPPGAGRP